MMGLTTDQIAQVAQVLDWQNVAVANGWATAAQVADGFTSAGYKWTTGYWQSSTSTVRRA